MLLRLFLTRVFRSSNGEDPTIKYFLDGDKEGKDYQSGRSYDDLKKFVEETLEVKCDVANPVECTDKEKGYIEKMKAKGAADIQKQFDRLDGMKGGKMAKEQKAWLMQRYNILSQLKE